MYKKAGPEKKESGLPPSSIKLETKPPNYNGDHIYLNPRYEGFLTRLIVDSCLYLYSV